MIRTPLGVCRVPQFLIRLGLIWVISFCGWVELRFYVVGFLGVGFHVGFLPTTFQWAKRPTWKLNLSLQLCLWYHRGIDSVMTHGLGSGCLIEEDLFQNERLWHALDIGNLFGAIFGFKKSQYFQLRNQITKRNCSPPHFYLPTWENFAPPYASPILVQNLFE